MTEPTLENLLSACREHPGGEPSSDLSRRTDDFVARARKEPSILSAAAAELPRLPDAGAAWLAFVFGMAITQGAPADRTTGPVVDLFFSWLPRLPATADTEEDDGTLPAPTPEQAALLQMLPRLCQSVVAHLARSPERRASLARDAALLDRLERHEDYSLGVAWIREALLRISGPLVVLHPPSGQGFRLRYENVSNGFLLFSLLQCALGRRLPGGRRPDPAVGAAARGKSRAELTDHAWWHYGDPRAPKPELQASIWGEASVRSIPEVQGVQTLLLWPPLLQSRGWDAGFFHPHIEDLPPNVVVERKLPAEECRALLDQLGVEPATRRWWQWR
jgi:hypothetical protein